eukprot:1481348-Prymnesium_polylepis.1
MLENHFACHLAHTYSGVPGGELIRAHPRVRAVYNDFANESVWIPLEAIDGRPPRAHVLLNDFNDAWM